MHSLSSHRFTRVRVFFRQPTSNDIIFISFTSPASAAVHFTHTSPQVIAADAHVRVSLVRARHEQRTAYLLLIQRVSNAGGGNAAAIRSAALHVPVPPNMMSQVCVG